MKIIRKLLAVLFLVSYSYGAISQKHELVNLDEIKINVRPECNDQNWTHFRGSKLNGIAEDCNPPIVWNDSANILWKTSIHNVGWSSPVIYEDQIWTTTATSDGKKMYVLCLDASTGEIIHNILLFEPDTVFSKHSINSYATPSPCIENGFVFVSFGRYGTACLDTHTGKTLWKRSDLKCTHVQGPGSSPIIYKNSLIVHLEGEEVQSIFALDKRTGETIWKIYRPSEIYEDLRPICRIAYITPLVVNVKGEDQLISNGSAVCSAYDPETGNEIWRVVKGENATIAMPFEENGIIYYYAGFISTPEGEKYSELLAVNPDGKGDISETNIIWSIKSPTLQMLTPVIKDGLIYTLDTRNNMQCIDALTGNIIWSERMKGKFNASPLWANGHIYFFSTNGNTIVIKEGREFNQIVENQIKGEIWATPAIYGNSLIIRTKENLYRIGLTAKSEKDL
ncbi:MAG: PQQ-binding-like beta-propeller repeat protein [Bacteroidales bacterium]